MSRDFGRGTTRVVGPRDGLDLYLRSIDASKLLTAREERELSRRIVQQNCPEARERMVRSNLRLVVAIAKRYRHRGLPLQDLIEEGNVGLLRAVECFDPDRGVRFVAYASWWIKQAIKRSLLNARHPVHIPVYLAQLVPQWKQTYRMLSEDLERPPTDGEIAKSMGIPVRRAEKIGLAAQMHGRSAQSESGSSEGFSLDVVARSSGEMPDHAATRTDELRLMRESLGELEPRQQEVLRLRFGLGGQEPMSLREVSKQIGLTREGVRQIERQALRELYRKLSDKQV